jgi:amino acid transporter
MPTETVNASADLIAVAAVLVGFAVTVIMFRVQREIDVQEEHPDWPNWLAWSDYLILGSVLVSLSLVVTPLLVFPRSPYTYALAPAACIAAIFLQVGYIPAILAHYRIEIGTERTKKGFRREKGEPMERVFVTLAAVLAGSAFAIVLCQRMHS